MEAAAKNKRNPHYNSMYADLASIIEAVRKPLTDNGLAFSQTIWFDEHGLFLQTTLLHVSGQWLKSEYPLLQGTAQQTGSSLTYARRYSLSSIAGIAADEDDDGAAATKANGSRAQSRKAPKEAPISQESLNILIRECDETNTDKRDLCKYFGVPSMADLTPDQFAEAMAWLKRKREEIEHGDAQGEALL
jgi:hypothetical protein